jgi:hypothetical protein
LSLDFATIRGPPQWFDEGWATAANDDRGGDEYSDLPFFEDDAA